MEIKIENLLHKIADLKFQLAKTLPRIEELEKENKLLKEENTILKSVFDLYEIMLSVTYIEREPSTKRLKTPFIYL